MTSSARSPTPFVRMLRGSFAAVLGGWLAAVVSVFFTFLAMALAGRFPNSTPSDTALALFIAPLLAGFFLWAFVYPVWMVALIPLYAFVPSSSVLWRWPVCMACGGAAGFLIVAALVTIFPWSVSRSDPDYWMPFVLGTIVGGVTCLIGARNRNRFVSQAPAGS